LVRADWVRRLPARGAAMNCDNEFCLYNQDYVCLIPNIRRNRSGDCGECILVALDKDFLEAEKERQLRVIDAQWVADEKRRTAQQTVRKR